MKKAVKNFPVFDINKIMCQNRSKIFPYQKSLTQILAQKCTSLLKIKLRRESLLMTNLLTRYILSITSLLMTSSKWNLLMSIMLFKRQSLNECRHIIQLDAILLGKDRVAFRLSLLEMTYREFLSDNRCQRQISLIVQQIVEGIEELHKLGYDHRDLKPENIMMNVQPLRVYIIDFNRAQRVQASAQGNVYGTLGYFPERFGEWRHSMGYLAVIIIESDMPRNDYFIRGERDSKQRIKQYLDKNKINGGLRELAYQIIMKPSQENQQKRETIKHHLRKLKFRELPHDSKLMFV